jgi:parvulin-like peptidyl-prolyl isomerase
LRGVARARAAGPAAALLPCLLAAACSAKPEAGRAGAGPAGDVPAELGQTVVTLGGRSIPYGTFERYLAAIAMDEESQGEQEDTIKSRLLDQFIEEQLLLGAAEKMQISVSDAEVDSFLQELGVTEGEAEVAGAEGRVAFRDKVRQSMVLQKVKDQAVLSKVQVTPGEVEDYFKKQPDMFRVPRAVVLRQILLDDRGQAERLAAALAADPAKFETLAREHSVAPDKGQARKYTEEELPVELREPLFELREGEVGRPLEFAGRWLLFQVVARLEAENQDLADVRRRIQMELFQKKGEQALERFIANLKKETEIRVNRAILPFQYNGEYRS